MVSHREGVIAGLRAENERLNGEAHRLTRTIERIRYDHPALDIDAHAKSIAPHGGKLHRGAGCNEDGSDPFLSTSAPAAAGGGAGSEVVAGGGSGDAMVDSDVAMSAPASTPATAAPPLTPVSSPGATA